MLPIWSVAQTVAIWDYKRSFYYVMVSEIYEAIALRNLFLLMCNLMGRPAKYIDSSKELKDLGHRSKYGYDRDDFVDRIVGLQKWVWPANLGFRNCRTRSYNKLWAKWHKSRYVTRFLFCTRSILVETDRWEDAKIKIDRGREGCCLPSEPARQFAIVKWCVYQFCWVKVLTAFAACFVRTFALARYCETAFSVDTVHVWVRSPPFGTRPESLTMRSGGY